MFRMLKLKPPNGWSAVAWELAIVTLGVLIALAAQNFVEEWNWQSRVRHAERQLVDEAYTNFYFAAERLIVAPCINAQLDQLVERAIALGPRLEPVDPVNSLLGVAAIRQPSRPFRTDSWEGIVGDGVAAHLDDERRDLFATLYTQLRHMKSLSDQSDEGKARLSQFLAPLELSPEVRARLVEQSLLQKSVNDLMALVSVQIMDSMWALGKAPLANDTDRRIARGRGTIKYCRDHQLPLADWRLKLSEERASAIANNDPTGKYVMTKQ